MEFDFTIELKQGRDNVAADALSRKEDLECHTAFVHSLDTKLVTKIIKSWELDTSLQNIIKDLQANPLLHRHYTYCNGELRRKQRLEIRRDLVLRKKISNIFAWNE
jgi:hypothetical protein